MSAITSQKHGGALIRAGALNGDNTVCLSMNWFLNLFVLRTMGILHFNVCIQFYRCFTVPKKIGKEKRGNTSSHPGPPYDLGVNKFII